MPLITVSGQQAADYGQQTYDRAVIKMDAEKIAAANRELYLPSP